MLHLVLMTDVGVTDTSNNPPQHVLHTACHITIRLPYPYGSGIGWTTLPEVFTTHHAQASGIHAMRRLALCDGCRAFAESLTAARARPVKAYKPLPKRKVTF